VWPNPFNPRTTIRFDLPEAGPARLSVFDVAGHLVRTLVDESLSLGRHEAVWDGLDSSGRAVGSGSYLARLEFGGRIETVGMGLVR
jgi:flagellar hook assembly protein FlgD